MIKTLWVINNKYWLQFCETKQKSSYYDLKKIIEQEIAALKIREIVHSSKLTPKLKVSALLIKTRTYGVVFSALYKFRYVKK